MSAKMSWTYKGKKYAYQLTPADELNLMRAAQFEGKPQSAVVWTLLQRFALLTSKIPGSYPTLSSLILAYVQPLNPRWYPTGDLHLKQMDALTKAGKTLEAATEKVAATRRLLNSRTPETSLEPAVVQIVKDILSGKNTRSPDQSSVHYWASRASSSMTQDQARAENQKRKPDLTLLDLGFGFKPGVNVFFTEPGVKGALGAVGFSPDLGSSGGKTILVSAVIGTAAYLAYRLWGNQ